MNGKYTNLRRLDAGKSDMRYLSRRVTGLKTIGHSQVFRYRRYDEKRHLTGCRRTGLYHTQADP